MATTLVGLGASTFSMSGAFAAERVPVPEDVEISAVSAHGAALTWDNVDDALAYDVSFTRKKNSDPKSARRVAPEDPEFVTTTLQPETTYWVRIRTVTSRGASEFSDPIEITTLSASVPFTIGTWNICASACDDFKARSNRQANWVDNTDVDVLALQEAGHNKNATRSREVFSGGPRNLAFNPGGANSRYLFHNREINTAHAGGSWDLGDKRWATWSRMTDDRNDEPFLVVNVHLVSGKLKADDAARNRQVAVLLKRIADERTDDEPVILVGDFNSGPYRQFDSISGPLADAGFTDSRAIAVEKVNDQINTGSRNGTKTLNDGNHVDHIYVTAGLAVTMWRQWVHLKGSTYLDPDLTDHNLIAATIELPSTDTKLGEVTEFSPVRIVTSTQRNVTIS